MFAVETKMLNQWENIISLFAWKTRAVFVCLWDKERVNFFGSLFSKRIFQIARHNFFKSCHLSIVLPQQHLTHPTFRAREQKAHKKYFIEYCHTELI